MRPPDFTSKCGPQICFNIWSSNVWQQMQSMPRSISNLQRHTVERHTCDDMLNFLRLREQRFTNFGEEIFSPLSASLRFRSRQERQIAIARLAKEMAQGSNCCSWVEQMSTLAVREGIGKSLRELCLLRSQGRHVLSYSMRPTLLVDVLSVNLRIEHALCMQLKLVSRAL